MLGKLIKLYLYYNFFTNKKILKSLTFIAIYFLAGVIPYLLYVKSLPILVISIPLIAFYLTNTILPTSILSKSDIDFLLMLPIEEKTIIGARILSNFILLLLFMVTFMVPYFSKVYGILQSIVIIVLLTILISLQQIALYNLRVHLKVLISVLILVWFLSAIIGFPYSSLSLSIRVYPGLAGLILLFFFLAVRNLSNYKYYVVQGVGREVEKNISFTLSHPFINIFKVVMNGSGFVGVSRLTSTYVIKRIRVSTLVAISSILAIIYYILVSYLVRHLSTNHFFSFLIYLYSLLFMSSYVLSYGHGTFTSQPLWLLVNSSIDLVEYIRYILISRAIKLFIILLPFVIVLILTGQYGSALTVALGFPFSTIYITSIEMRFNPIQVREQVLPTNMLTFRSLITFLLSFLLVLVLIGVVVLNMIIFKSLLLPLIANITSVPISAVFLFWRDFWERAINNAVERGLI
ncbi:MAG: hypothetical protein OWQ54_04895 [Sulfolobaceae archaeon]|nr:hypothetical protein [Sulfolobaceae archaeon]